MKCFYHADHDGHCAAYWVHKRYPVMQIQDFIEINYGYDFNKQVLSLIQRDEPVIIVDFSFLPDEMRSLHNMTHNITWIDHHITAINKYKDFDINIKGIRYDGLAGCMLTYIYYFQINMDTRFDHTLEEKAPWMTKFISDYDTWTYKYDLESINFKLGLDAEDTDVFSPIWDELVENHNKVVELINNGKIIDRFNRAEFARSLNRGFEWELDGHKIFCENNLKGDSTNFLWKMNDYEACLQFYYDGEFWHYSLYSEKIDCTQVSICGVKFEGHKGASGAQSKELFIQYKER